MTVRKLEDSRWICDCYPNGRSGKRVRKRFATKAEAAAFERHTMREVDEKPWLGVATDRHPQLASSEHLVFNVQSQPKEWLCVPRQNGSDDKRNGHHHGTLPSKIYSNFRQRRLSVDINFLLDVGNRCFFYRQNLPLSNPTPL